MATLYQEHSKEGNAKTEELTSAVKELQGLLAEADKKYAKQEIEVNEAKNKQEEVLTKNEETIGALKNELEAGNTLIKIMKEKAELRQSEAEEARRRLASVERDRDRQTQQASDLGRQVATTMRQVHLYMHVNGSL